MDTSTVESTMRIVEWRNASHLGHLENIQHVVVSRGPSNQLLQSYESYKWIQAMSRWVVELYG